MDDPIDLNSADQEAIDAIEELQGHGPEIVRYPRRARRLFDLRRLDEVPRLTGKVTDAARARLKLGS